MYLSWNLEKVDQSDLNSVKLLQFLVCQIKPVNKISFFLWNTGEEWSEALYYVISQSLSLFIMISIYYHKKWRPYFQVSKACWDQSLRHAETSLQGMLRPMLQQHAKTYAPVLCHGNLSTKNIGLWEYEWYDKNLKNQSQYQVNVLLQEMKQQFSSKVWFQDLQRITSKAPPVPVWNCSGPKISLCRKHPGNIWILSKAPLWCKKKHSFLPTLSTVSVQMSRNRGRSSLKRPS